MANQSKIYFENLAGVRCCDITHTETTNCLLGSLFFGGNVMKRASLLFFAPIYLIQLCLRGRNITPTYLKQHLHAYIQSSLFGGLYATVFMMSNCFLRKLMGKYTYYTVALIPGILSGMTILLEHKSRRTLEITTMVNWTLECMLQWLETHKNFKRTPVTETAVFMILSAVLMYLLRKTPAKINKTPHLWFFVPPPLKKPETKNKVPPQDANHNEITSTPIARICPHAGSCWKDIVKSASKYMGIGFALQMVRSLLPHQRNMQNMKQSVLRDRKTFLLALFLGGYVAIYKTVSCILNQTRGTDSEAHALLAGFLAGCCYYLHPNTTFLLTAITTILQALATKGVSSGLIPDSALMGGMVFAICNALLTHTLIIDPQVTPKFFNSILSFGTQGWSDSVQRTVLKILAQAPS